MSLEDRWRRFDAALDRLTAAVDTADQNAAPDAVAGALDTLYDLWEAFRTARKAAGLSADDSVAANDPAGETVAALIYARGGKTHDADLIEFGALTDSFTDTFRDTFAAWCWGEYVDESQGDRSIWYGQHVAGQELLAPFAVARGWLALQRGSQALTANAQIAPAELAAMVAGLAGKKVLEVVNEPGSGSLLHLGEWVRRPRPIPNDHLTEHLRNFRGSDSLFVQCPWVLDSPDDLGLVVDASDARTRMLSRMDLLQALIGQTITGPVFLPVDMSLTLAFETLGATLRLEPRLEGGDLDEYSVQLGDQYRIVRQDGRVFQTAVEP